VKKKSVVTSKDKKDWLTFAKNMENVKVKEADFSKNNENLNKFPKIDLHGFSLNQANKMVKEFIIKSFYEGHKKILVITGKGTRSKSEENPYISSKLSMLKHSIPDYIKNNDDLMSKISSISNATLAHGGEGAIYIFLKK
tara:strand:+ start:3528 stop:3947 length:420 start_codon:yes stop_codon:yes gene_type:complete